MSHGFGAHGKLSICDDKKIEYAYCSYNINDPDYVKIRDELNGKIVLDLNIFKTIDAYRRYKGEFSDRERKALKVTPDELNYQTLQAKGMVQIINSRGAWRLDDNGIDRHAIMLFYRIIEDYSKTEKFPKTLGLFY